jgi:spore maturation protein CgeB
VVVKASGVGVFDDYLLNALLDTAAPEAVRMFCDVDAAATLDEMRGAEDHPLRRRLAELDLVITYGGGPPVVAAYTGFGARRCEPIYNALDPETHHPGGAGRALRRRPELPGQPPARPRGAGGGVLPARGEALPDKRFLLGGNGWDDKPMSANITRVGHVGTGDHNAFNTSSLAVLNVARDSMAAVGFSPATRVFEAAGAGACLITDAWEGIEQFLQPDREVLVARDGQDVAEHMRALTPERARAIGMAGRARILSSTPMRSAAPSWTPSCARRWAASAPAPAP